MSSAWRSLLRQPHPHLLSRLIPLGRHGSQLTTDSRRSSLIGSRGYASESNNGDATTKRHLYVALDDHKDGYSVHKLDLSENGDHDLDGGTTTRRLITEPPVLRVTRTTLGDRAQFAAVGNSIVAIGTTVMSPMLYGTCGPDKMGGVLIYDTKAFTFTVAPHLPRGLCCGAGGYKAAIPVGNSLYMLGPEPPFRPCWTGGRSLHCLTTDPPVDQDIGTCGEKFWGWEPLSADSYPWCWSNYENPPMVPFFAEYITAHMVVTAGTSSAQQDILVSVRPTKRSVLGATFSFSRASNKWTWHGEWLLPAVGHAHYDSHLDTWIGLSAADDGNMYGVYGPRVTDGHLCSGNIMSAPWWVVGKDKLFRLDEDATVGWRHASAKLVPISEGSSHYCLMEHMCPEEDEEEEKENGEEEEEKENGEEEEEEEEFMMETKKLHEDKTCWGDGDRRLLRLTTFHIEHGKHGEPIVTARMPTRCYEVSSYSKHFEAQAFCM